jgi:DNA repair exonuclease SbcCD ATPase subunit
MTSLKIRSLELHEFRGFRNVTIHCDADIVLIYGRNGVGKTTIFDAVEYALFGGNRRLQKLGQSWQQHLPNVHGNGTFDITLLFQSAERIKLNGDRNGNTEGTWAGYSEMRNFIYERLMRTATLGRRNVAAIHDLSLATHLLLQSQMANFAASGTLDSEKLAALTGSGYLERCHEKAGQTRLHLSRRKQDAESQLIDIDEGRAQVSARAEHLTALMQRRGAVVDNLRTNATGTIFEAELLRHIAAQPRPTESVRISGWLRDAARNSDDAARIASTLLNVEADSLDEAGPREAADSLRAERDRAIAARKDLTARLEQKRQEFDRQQRERFSLSQRRDSIAALLQDVMTLAANLERLPQLVSVSEASATTLGKAAAVVEAANEEASRLNALLAEGRAELARRQSNARRLQQAHDASVRAQTQSHGSTKTFETTETATTAAKARYDTAAKAAEEAKLVFDREQETFAKSASDIDILIAELRGLLSREEACPLCGTPFGSSTALRRAIEGHAARHSEAQATAQQRLEQRRRIRDDALRVERVALAELQRLQAQLEGARERMVEARAETETTSAQLAALGPTNNDVESSISSLLAAADVAARDVAARESTASDADANLAMAREIEQTARARSRADSADRQNLQDQINTQQKRIEAVAAALRVTIDEPSLRFRIAEIDVQIADSNERQEAGIRQVRQHENELQELTQRLADSDKRLAVEQSRLQDAVTRLETYQRQVAALGFQSNPSRQELDTRRKEATSTGQQLRALADSLEELARIETSATAAELNSARAELQKIDLKRKKVSDELRAIDEASKTVSGWEQTLRKRVDVAIESFVIPREAEIDRTFRSLIADPFRFEGVELRHRTKGLELGLVFRNLRQASGSPEFFLSAAQMSALALSIFLALARSQQWSNLDVIMLDDPVQHLDDLDCVALLDGLRSVARQSRSKQLMISTCDRTLYHQMIRKFTLGTAPSGTSLIAMTLEEDLKDGVVVRYDIGGSGENAAATA